MFQFRLLHGSHSENEASDENDGLMDGTPGIAKPFKLKVYFQGDIIHTDKDLSVHNTRGSMKFEKIGEVVEDTEELLEIELQKLERRRQALLARKMEQAAPAAPEAPSPRKRRKAEDAPAAERTLNEMTVAELMELASANEIPLDGARTKAEMIQVLEAATQPS